MTTGEPTLEPLIGRCDPPPLRIHHIMVATAVIAVLLSINHSLRQTNSFGLSSFATSGRGITMAITAGLAATIVGFGFAWRRSGYSFFDQPGNWLLLSHSLTIGFFMMAAAICAFQLPDSHIATSIPFGAFYFLLIVLGIALNLWAAWRIADSIPWKFIFLVDGLTVICLFGVIWLGFRGLVPIVIWGAPIAVLLLLLLASWADRRDHVRRDWPHWLGVCLRSIPILQTLGQPIWVWAATAVNA
jgi:hypothetical protein